MDLFATERLIARRLTQADVPSMMLIYGDAETVRFVGDGTPLALSDCNKWIEVTDNNFEKRGYGMVGFVSKETGELIGCAGVVHPDKQP